MTDTITCENTESPCMASENQAVPVNTMKAYEGSGDTASAIPNFGTRRLATGQPYALAAIPAQECKSVTIK
jgi:hypothetical protein